MVSAPLKDLDEAEAACIRIAALDVVAQALGFTVARQIAQLALDLHDDLAGTRSDGLCVISVP